MNGQTEEDILRTVERTATVIGAFWDTETTQHYVHNRRTELLQALFDADVSNHEQLMAVVLQWKEFERFARSYDRAITQGGEARQQLKEKYNG